MGVRDRNKQDRVMSVAGLAALAAILAIAFQAWQSPAMLIHFASFILCV
jgi:hypothetical protein